MIFQNDLSYFFSLIANYQNQIQAQFFLTVGGAFDIWSGAKKRAPIWIQKIGMEWLFRSFYDISKASMIFRNIFRFMYDYCFAYACTSRKKCKRRICIAYFLHYKGVIKKKSGGLIKRKKSLWPRADQAIGPRILRQA